MSKYDSFMFCFGKQHIGLTTQSTGFPSEPQHRRGKDQGVKSGLILGLKDKQELEDRLFIFIL